MNMDQLNRLKALQSTLKELLDLVVVPPWEDGDEVIIELATPAIKTLTDQLTLDKCQPILTAIDRDILLQSKGSDWDLFSVTIEDTLKAKNEMEVLIEGSNERNVESRVHAAYSNLNHYYEQYRRDIMTEEAHVARVLFAVSLIQLIEYLHPAK